MVSPFAPGLNEQPSAFEQPHSFVLRRTLLKCWMGSNRVVRVSSPAEDTVFFPEIEQSGLPVRGEGHDSLTAARVICKLGRYDAQGAAGLTIRFAVNTLS